DRHTERGANTGAGVADAEGVVLTFATLRKTGESVELAHRAHLLATAGQNLVRIGLVADIPAHAIVGGVVEVMQCDCQLDYAESGAKMSAGLADRVQQKFAQLNGELRQL